MIVDDLRAASAGFRDLTAGAQVIRVPYEVCPYTEEPDGTPGLYWQGWTDERRNLIPRGGSADLIECSWWRPPFERMIVASESHEAGVMVVQQAPNQTGRHHEWAVAVALIALDRRAGVVIPLCSFKYVEDAGSLAFLDDPRHALCGMGIATLWHALRGTEYRPSDVVTTASGIMATIDEEDLQRDRVNAASIFATTMALMCCRNVSTEVRRPDARLQAARQRRGALPLVSWHLLKVGRPALRGSNRAGAGEPLALHWVRGHFKRYTEDRPLLGRAVGMYWWSPHLAGRADRVVLKDYEVHRRGGM